MAGIIRAGQGNFGYAGMNLAPVVPFSSVTRLSRLGKVANVVDDVAKEAQVVEGIYEFVAASGKRHVEQSMNIAARIQQHLASGKPLPEALDTVRTTQVLGGKTAREIAEQLRINDLGGIYQDGVKVLDNIRDPIGKARKYLLP